MSIFKKINIKYLKSIILTSTLKFWKRRAKQAKINLNTGAKISEIENRKLGSSKKSTKLPNLYLVLPREKEKRIKLQESEMKE